VSIRKIRIVVAGTVLVLFAAIFLGGKTAAPLALSWLPRTQFVPALLKTAAGFAGTGILVLAGLLSITLLFGRVYCSFLCPLGILQDVFIRFSKLAGKRRKGGKGGKSCSPRPAKDLPVLRYAILTLTALGCVLGSFTLLNLLDPYSLFGRVMRDIVLPPATSARRLVALGLEQFDVYALSGPSAYLPAWSVWAVSAYALLLLAVLAMKWGRLYCNAVCPVGALLGLFSRVAMFRPRIVDADCVECGICERGCRGGCIDVETNSVDASRCVMCFDCVSECPKDAVALRRAGAADVTVVPARRRLLAGSVSSLSMVLLGFSFRGRGIRLLRESVTPPIVPPGAGSVAQFARQCSACHLCVAACPHHVMKPSMASYGGVGAMQPTMCYDDGFCDYDCNVCGRVCPTGAIRPLPLEEKQLTRIGRVRFIESRCVVYIRDEDCGACAELCPTHAAYTVEEDGVLYPKINPDLCIGCGACENACPQSPRAILVDPVQKHGYAKPPFYDQAKPEPPPENTAVGEDFPF